MKIPLLLTGAALLVILAATLYHATASPSTTNPVSSCGLTPASRCDALYVNTHYPGLKPLGVK